MTRRSTAEGGPHPVRPPRLPGGLAAFLVALAALTALAVAGDRIAPVRPQPSPAVRVVPLAAATLVCPPLPAAAAGLDMAGLPVPPAGGGWNSAPLSGPGSTTSPATGAGTIPARPGGTTFAATGPAAAGLSLQQIAAVPGPAIAATNCTGPSADPRYFLGASGSVGVTDTLQLVNPDPSPAVADVTVWTAAGQLSAPAGQGIQVPAGSRVQLPVADLAPDASTVALEVAVRVGRLTSAVVDQPAGAGTDYLPVQQAPAEQVVLPGFPGGTGRRLLYLADPGAASAAVSVRVISGSSNFIPSGMQSLQVAAGTVAGIDLSRSLPGPGAVIVTSDAPILATGVFRSSDLAWVGPARRISGPTPFAVPGPAPFAAVRRPPGGLARLSTTIIALAPGPAAVLTVSGVGGNPTRTFTVPAGSTSAFLAPVGPGGIDVVRASGGPVYIAEEFSRGGVAVVAVATPPAAVSLREVSYDPLAAYGP